MTPAELAANKKNKRRKIARVPRKSGIHKCRMSEIRKELGLSLRDVGEGIGMSAAGLHAIEHGADVQLTSMRKLAEFFGTTISELWPA